MLNVVAFSFVLFSVEPEKQMPGIIVFDPQSVTAHISLQMHPQSFLSHCFGTGHRSMTSNRVVSTLSSDFATLPLSTLSKLRSARWDPFTVA